MKSIIQINGSYCFLCGCTGSLEKHHIFGAFNRKKSEQYGLTVRLCHSCHNEPPQGVHHNKRRMELLHRIGQQAFENTYPEQDFRAVFGRNYI